jgi:hypothetical protein
VAPEALAEIYSRSWVVAMPSRRETFGLVAVQAMLCGTPVVAAAVGGLRETIFSRRTGIQVPPSDPPALAFVLAGLIRHPALCAWLGKRAREWARPLFSNDGEHSGARRIMMCQEGLPVGAHPLEDPVGYVARQHGREVATLVGAENEPEWIPSGHNSLFRLRSSGREHIAKRFTGRPDFDEALYVLPRGMRAAGGAARLNRSVAAGRNPFALEATPSGERVLLFEACTLAEAEESEIAALAEKLPTAPPHPPEEAAQSCRDAIRTLAAQRSREALDAFDRAAGWLNASLSGDETVFVRCHPFAELCRLKLHADARAWPLPNGQDDRMKAIVTQSLRLDLTTVSGPTLAHGDLSRRHVLRRGGALVLCDLAQARFAFGNLDCAGLAVDHARIIAAASPEAAVASLLRAAVAKDAQAWLICELLHRALGSAFWGRHCALEQSLGLCEALLAGLRPR